VAQLQKSITFGKKEILKAIAGESPFKPEEIRESIDPSSALRDFLLWYRWHLDSPLISC
jgi:hypothetical protein